jgi:large subunit ribosomal protein L25
LYSEIFSEYKGGDMGDKIELTLQPRTVTGKAVKRLRQEGTIPAVVYGQDFAAGNFMVSEMVLGKVYKAAGKHLPIEVQLGNQRRLAMVKDADIDPVKHKLRHVAFHVIKQNEKVTTEVPIIIEQLGETPAEKAGLVILTTIDSVEVEALPRELPEHAILPGEKLAEIGDHVTVADVRVPKGVTVTSDPTQIIATVYEPSALQAANEADNEEAKVEDVEAEHGGDTPQDTQAEENQPGGKKQQPAKE